MNDLYSPIGDYAADTESRISATAIALFAITLLVALAGGAFSVIYP